MQSKTQQQISPKEIKMRLEDLVFIIEINRSLKSKSSASCLQKHNSLTKGLICPVKIIHCPNCGAFFPWSLNSPAPAASEWKLTLASLFNVLFFSLARLSCRRGGESLSFSHTLLLFSENILKAAQTKYLPGFAATAIEN